MNTDVLSTRQVATLLGVGEATVKRWADAGEIDCFETPGLLPDGVPPGADELGDAAVEHFKSSALRGETPALVAQLSALRLRGHDLQTLFDEVVAPALHR